MINYFLSSFLEIQWAESKELEFVLLIFIALGYFMMKSIYKGAYFYNKSNPTVFAVIFLLLGLANIYLSSSSLRTPMIVDGLVTFNSIMLVSGLLWISIPVAHFTRVLVDKRRGE